MLLRSFLFTLAGLLLTAGSAFSDPIPVGGRILDSKGKPLARATAELHPLGSDFKLTPEKLKNQITPEPVATAVADAEGRFQLMVPEPGMWRVKVQARGYVPRSTRLLPLLEATELPVARLEPDSPLTVRIVDEAGKPVAGAQVTATPDFSDLTVRLRRTLFDLWPADSRVGITAADGTVALPRISGEKLQISAFAPGYSIVRLAEVPSRPPAQIKMSRGCEVVLEVVGRERKPVAGAVVSSGSWALGVTGETGRLAVNAPCKEALRVRADLEDGRGAEVTVPANRPPQGEPVRLSLAAQPYRLTGTVVEQGSRKPLAGALVWSQDEPGRFVRTDGKGTYVLPVKTGVRHRIVAASASHLRDGTEIQVSEGAAQPGPTLALEPAALVGGTVVDEAGQPVEGVEILGSIDFSQRRNRWAETPRTRSGSRGAFRLRVAPAEGYTLRATREGFAPASLQVAGLKGHAARTDLRIVLGRGYSAAGKVLDPSDRPISGARIALKPAGQEDRMPRSFFEERDTGGYEAGSTADGRFTFQHLPAGRYDLEAQAAGFARVVVRGLEIRQEARATSLGTVILHPGVSLEGFVVDPQDRPVPGARVMSFLGARTRSFFDEGEGQEDQTGADGRFAIADLSPGERVRLEVEADGYARRELEGVEVPSSQPLRIVLQPGARIAGRVVDEDGKPVAEASLSVSKAGTGRVFAGRTFQSPIAHSGTDENGGFRIDGLEAGTLTLEAQARGFLSTQTGNLEVAPGRSIEGLEVVLRRGAVITGRILGPDGAPVSDARVTLVQEGAAGFMGPGAMTMSGGDGTYRLESVPPGPRSIQATHPDYQQAVRDLEVQPGENRADLRLTAGLSVAGRVLDTEGRPVEGARLSLFSRELRGNHPTARSAADGTFELTGIAAGTYTLEAGREGYSGNRISDIQVAGPVSGLEVRLERGGGVIRGRVTGLEFKDLAQVLVIAQSDKGGGQSQVDFQGEYRIETLTPGEWTVRAVHRGNQRRAEGKVTLAGAEAVLDLEFREGEGLTLSGRVVRGGEPVPGVNVYASSDERPSAGSVVTNQDGAFRISGLSQGTVRVMVNDFRGGIEHQEMVELTADRDIVIDLPQNRVSGQVVDAADSSPVEGAVISLESTADPESARGGRGASSDSQGAFTVANVTPGSYRIIARKEGYAPAESTVQVGESSSVEGVRLALSATQGLVLQVRSPLGQPATSVEAALLDPSGRVVLSGSYTAGENGRVRISSAPQGAWRLLISGGGSATQELNVNAPGPPVPVSLSPASSLRVTVPDLADSTLLGTLTIQSSNGRPFQTVGWGGRLNREWRVENGQATVDGLPAGSWRVTVTTPDGQTRQGTASTSPGAPNEVTLR